jgi:hypothetical protein
MWRRDGAYSLDLVECPMNGDAGGDVRDRAPIGLDVG